MKKKKESEGWEMVIGTYLMSMSLNTAPPESVDTLLWSMLTGRG